MDYIRKFGKGYFKGWGELTRMTRELESTDGHKTSRVNRTSVLTVWSRIHQRTINTRKHVNTPSAFDNYIEYDQREYALTG